MFSADGDVTVTIPAGVIGLTAGGAPLPQITITPITATTPPPPPPGTGAVALDYDVEPSGSTFSSPITITLSFDPGLLNGATPYVAWYNPVTGQWEQLHTVSIDTVNHTITASVDHFSTFAVLAALSKTSTTTSTAAGTTTNNTNITTTTTTSTTTTKSSVNGVVIGVIIGAVIVIALILFFIIRGRKPRGG